jgi:hypothetical protein
MAMIPYNELTAAERQAMTQAEKTAYIKAAREEKMAADAAARAASDPMKNPTERPEATQDEPGFIKYYGWVGGAGSGSWKLYKQNEVSASPDQLRSATERSEGGKTQASFSSAVGANFVPQPGGNVPGTTPTPSGTTPSGGTPPGNTPPSGGTPPAGGTPPVSASAVSTPAASDALTTAGRAERQSAYDLLLQQFNQYGLGALVEPLKGLITSGASPAEFTIKLRESDAYKKRFAANASRIAKGLTAISEAEYLGLEDQYQSIMRNYGLPPDYYARGDLGVQEGFNRFIANDVSAVELEDRISTAQSRVLNANPEVLASLREFYPGITNGDILAYTLDPTKAITDIRRKITAAEIGGAAMQAGLRTGMARAEELGAAGITKQQAQQGFGTIASGLQRGSQLASIYGEDPYTQTTAEKEVFGLTGQTEAEKQRKKLTGLEKATFSGQTGLTSAALARDRAGAY